MKSRAFRQTAVLLCILLFAGTPALGGPVVVREVVQVLGVSKNTISLRLQNSHQIDGERGTRTGPIDTRQGTSSAVDISDTPDTLLSGLSVVQGQQAGIDIADRDEVNGTICDCGEILVAGAGFTKWPFFLLAAVPLAFIPRGDDNPETPIPTPTPTPLVPTQVPTPQPVPEPATLLLFGSGLAAIGAGIRRRRADAKQNHTGRLES